MTIFTRLLDLFGLRRLRYPGNTAAEIEWMAECCRNRIEELREQGYCHCCSKVSDVAGYLAVLDRDLEIRSNRGRREAVADTPRIAMA